MSDTRPSPPRPRSGCLTVLMIGAGIVLLLPGACAIVFISGGGADGLASLSLLVSMAGLVLVALGANYEYRRNKARDEIEAPKGLTAGPRTAVMVFGVILAVGVVLGMIGWTLWQHL